jgi:sugar phosphate isomerase/epimerase
MPAHTNNFPKLHNAAWPGVVGKGSPGAEPFIELDKMLDMTAAAEVDGVKFDGVDLFLFDPHISIDASEDDLKRLVEKVTQRNLKIGSIVAPVWGGTNGGSAFGPENERKQFVEQVKKACRIGAVLRKSGVRQYGVIRIDTAGNPEAWLNDPEGNQKLAADTFRRAGKVAADHGEKLAAEGEICWGGMHSWRRMVQLLEQTDLPGIVGFQADMAHTLLYMLGYNAPEDRIVREKFDWQDKPEFDRAYRHLTDALRPWTIDFHVAQNDATVNGSGDHDKTGRHCQATDPNGKLDIPYRAGFWMRDGYNQPLRKFQHICWDGCMFPNEVMFKPQTWNDILAAMIAVRDAHGWKE